jgi:NADH pyrophosphatase NudC (nudix superfamily)
MERAMTDLMGKVRQGFAKSVTTVSVKSKELLEASKVKSQIADLEQRKKEALEELGNIAYAMYLSGTFVEERLKTKCAAISELDGQIRSRQSELAEIHARAQEDLGKPKPASICSCGAEIYEWTRFCGKCGKKVEPKAREAGASKQD